MMGYWAWDAGLLGMGLMGYWAWDAGLLGVGLMGYLAWDAGLLGVGRWEMTIVPVQALYPPHGVPCQVTHPPSRSTVSLAK